jgi:hypothetical protein
MQEEETVWCTHRDMREDRERGREGGREGWREEGREGGREGERPISHTDKGEVVKARIVTVVERRRKVDRWLYVSGVGGCRELGLRVSACQRSVPSFLSPSLSAFASLSTLSPLMSLSAFPLPLPLPRHLPPCLLFSLSHLADTTHTHTLSLSLSHLWSPPRSRTTTPEILAGCARGGRRRQIRENVVCSVSLLPE